MKMDGQATGLAEGVPAITDQGSVIPMNVAGRVWDSDVAYSFRNSPVAMSAAVVAFVLIFSAVFARWVAPHNPFDLATLNLLDASLPPMWEENSNPSFWLGTDDQGRDIFSAILFGMQVSLAIGLASVALSVVLGVGLGQLSGKAFRIAHMGHVNAPMMLGTLSVIEVGLQAMGVPHGKGGAQAAIDWLGEQVKA